MREHDPGQFDRRVIIETRGGEADDYGNVVPEWTEATRRWCRIQDTGGRELYRARQVDASIAAVITLRDGYEQLTAEDRIVYDGRVFLIESVLGRSDRNPARGQILHVKEDV